MTDRTPYIRMDGTRRPSIFALDRDFTPKKQQATRDSSNAFASAPLNLKGSLKHAQHKGAYSKAKGAV